MKSFFFLVINDNGNPVSVQFNKGFHRPERSSINHRGAFYFSSHFPTGKRWILERDGVEIPGLGISWTETDHEVVTVKKNKTMMFI